MMRLHCGGPGVGQRETREEIAARQKRQAIHARQTIAALGDRGKTEILSRAIVNAAQSRGLVSMQDCTQAGLCKCDVERLWDAAFASARAFYPAIDSLGAAA